MKIYILGSGAMATALVFGLNKSGFEVVIVARNADKVVNTFSNAISVATYGDSFDINNKNIILAFKPYALNEVAQKLSGEAKTCISVMARTNLSDLKTSIKAGQYIVCLPNIAAKHNKSVTPFLQSGDGDGEKILNGFGEAVLCESEAEFIAASTVAGCGAAYLAIIAESLQNGCVKEGARNMIAKSVVSALFSGFSALLKEQLPSQIKESVCSPAGTTIEGVAVLENRAVRGAIMDAVSASAKRQRQ